MQRREVIGTAGMWFPLVFAGCTDTNSTGDGNRTETVTTQDTRATQPTPNDIKETTTPDIPNQTIRTAEPTKTRQTPAGWPSQPYADYETTWVRVQTPGGKTIGTILAAVARTRDQRYLGLSDADSLPEDGGMLFVYDGASKLTFVMREMNFGIDIIYADSTNTITKIHHAPAPEPNENGEQQRYPGYGQYVLEVAYRWTERHGVKKGDVLDFDVSSRPT